VAKHTHSISCIEAGSIARASKTIVCKVTGDSFKIAGDPREHQRLEAVRREIISQNRSRLMRRLPPLPVPGKGSPPMKVRLLATDGTYIGTWPLGTLPEDAIEEAIMAGEIKKKSDAIIEWTPA